MTTIKAVIVDAHHHLILSDVDAPQAQNHEALVRVKAISLNRGELRRAASAQAGHRPGLDFAGEVEKAATGGGPKAGARVVGMLNTAAWAEVIPAPVSALAVLPDAVSFDQAATLPIAGLTALIAVEKRGGLLARKVLVTGASGGVGDFAVQLAHQSGAWVVAQVRNPAHVEAARAAGADEVAVGPDAQCAASFGPYDLIVEGVGGDTLSSAIGLIGPDGMLVSYSQTAGADVHFNGAKFYGTGSATIYGLIVFHENEQMPAGQRLSRLAALVERGMLRTPINVVADWAEIDAVAQQLIDRKFTGKAVLHVG